MATDPRSGATILDPAACWDLLASAEVGRLAVAVGRHPDVFPVNYLVDQTSIVFRTGEGTKLAAIVTNPDVAFEADGYHSETGEAWSVVVKGYAAEITRVFDLPDTSVLPAAPWQAGVKSRMVRIVPEQISGRQFHVLNTPTVGG